MNFANGITLARLVVTLVCFAALELIPDPQQPDRTLAWIAFIAFVFAAATDFVDGWVARRFGQVTAFGRVADPFVDKVLVCGAFVFLAGAGFRAPDGTQASGVQPWMVVLILGRELLVTGLRGFSESRGISFGAKGIGKAKMVLQSIAAPVLMFCVAHVDHWSGWSAVSTYVKPALVWVTLLVTALSMLPYLVQSKQILAEADAA